MCKHWEEGGRQVVVETPERIKRFRDVSCQESISIDSCIADEIKGMWELGVDTLGCCCGHFGRFGGALVIVPKEYSIKSVCDVIAKIESITTKEWRVSQWVSIDGEYVFITVGTANANV